jgi:hypothetical protein
MRAKSAVAKNVDEYIARYPSEVQKILRKIRATIRKAAPGAACSPRVLVRHGSA